MMIKYNAPVILTYTLIALVVTSIYGSGIPAAWVASPARLTWSDPMTFVRMISYIFGHSGLRHLMGNLMIILLVGPLLEEKFGSRKLLEMIVVTAIITAVLNTLLFSNSLIGGSGIAFMLILLSSFANIRSGQIPLTFVLVAFLFIGTEVTAILKQDQVSQFSHLMGGVIGACYGFVRKR